ncbi:hypothetical protein DDB_G0292950 [Dictyostelium discoideum AX4]|uniref:Uncharacterized protein n=1 Tax=Dictyostelium discoideum TaxID=44689 RepID=Q54CG6_DICDI|nr:hypothetical protein DDB_G0292950 [Dictyostelium discoideum AX4]EAL61024.1 hypothetical protein DDB_G0292950 [Dictyostelium discoideum AX4]|eukprot:XP_629450.1 hypothetical protein DDB_G0292950 [Dictyostelium discoideum AX4]
MDFLFYKVFKNKYLINKIYSYITQHNKEQTYIGYNYYDFPLELILKTKNQPLLIEKINNYNKYFKNNNNNNNNKSIIESKHFLNFSEYCLKRLYKWRELPFELFEIVFETFKNEITEINKQIKKTNKEIKYHNKLNYNSPYIARLVRIDYNSIIIGICDLKKLKYLINNKYLEIETIDIEPIFKMFDKFKRTVNGDDDDDDDEIKKKKEIFRYILSELKIDVSFRELVHYLEYIIKTNQSKLFGSLILEYFPNKFQILYDPFYSAINNLFSAISKYQDQFMLKLLLEKYKYTPLPPTKLPLALLENNDEIVKLLGISIERSILESFDIPIGFIFESFNLDIVKVLCKNFYWKYFQRDKEPIHKQRLIYDSDVAIWLNDNYFEELKNLYNVKISWVCDYQLRKIGKREQVKFETLPLPQHKYIDYYFLQSVNKEMIESNLFEKEIPFFYNPLEILNVIIKNQDVNALKSYFKRFPKKYNYNQIKKAFESGSSSSNKELHKCFLENIINHGNICFGDGSSPSLFKTNLILLLIHSIQCNLIDLFNYISPIILQHYVELDERSSFFFNQEDDNKIYDISILNFKFNPEFVSWLKSNPGTARKWLYNSQLRKVYTDIVSNMVFEILGQIYSSISKINKKNSKFVIAQLISNENILKGLSKWRSKTFALNIIRFAILNSIIFTNSQIKSFGFSLNVELLFISVYNGGFLNDLSFCSISLERKLGNSFILHKILIKLFLIGHLSINNSKINYLSKKTSSQHYNFFIKNLNTIFNYSLTFK